MTREDIAALRQADFDAAMAATDAQAIIGTATGANKGGSPQPSAETLVAESANADMSTVVQTAPAGPPSLEEVPLSDDEKERLIELAKQRALAVKDHLTETGGLDPERLFVCYSDVDTEKVELPPRVDLSI